MKAVGVVRTTLKVAGFAVFAVAYLVFLLLTGVGFYIEDAPVLSLAYVVSSLCLLAGLAWPRAFVRFAKAGVTRWRVAVIFGVPAGVLLALLYFLTTFHLQDLNEIVLLLFAAASLALIAGLARPSVFDRFSRGTITRTRIAAFFGAAAVALFLVFLVTLPVLETHRLARLERADADRQRAVSSMPPAQVVPNDDGRVEVYPLHVGDTVVTYGQFYGGLSGWEGLAGYARTLVGKEEITVPVYAYLIDHPEHGLMLVDTGVSWDQAHDHDGYYSGVLARLLSGRDEYILPVEQELEVQIARLGYEIGDIEKVFMTHVHDDHAGGLRSVPNAKVFLAKQDREEGVVYAPSFETADDDLELVSYTSGPFRNFDASEDVFGDGSVRLLPTPGHSPGHTSILLRMDGYNLLFVGDHAYTLRHLAVEEVRQMTIGGEETEKQVEGIRRVRKLSEDLPNTVMLHAHDHTDYQFDLIEPSLADGNLSDEERREIEAYEDSVFTADWSLHQGNAPRFVPPEGEESTGKVKFH